MQPAQRRVDSRVIERLLDEPYRFQFFQAVRVLERWFVERGGARQRDVLPHRIGFRTTLSTSFPPSEIERIAPHDEAGEVLEDEGKRAEAIEAGKLGRVDLTPAFFGLLGGQGALPLRYTEQLAEREHVRRDRAARAFFDVFSNRATALFYSAWKKYRLPFHYELERDERYLPILLSLAGVGDAKARASLHDGPGALFDEAVAGYSVAARHRPASAAYLQQTLAEYFGVPVRVEQFVGKWYRVPAEQLSRLGQHNVVLGANALSGERIWQRDLRARFVLGPLSFEEYESFLPGAERAIALERMLKLLAGVTSEYEVSLVLRRADVGSVKLGAGARLGWDAFLCTRPSERDRDDTRYELNLEKESHS